MVFSGYRFDHGSNKKIVAELLSVFLSQIVFRFFEISCLYCRSAFHPYAGFHYGTVSSLWSSIRFDLFCLLDDVVSQLDFTETHFLYRSVYCSFYKVTDKAPVCVLRK